LKLRHDLVLITWDDAGELSLGWVQDHEIQPKEMLAVSIGLLAAKTPKHLVIVSTVGETESCCHQFQIPRRMVKHIQVIAKRGSEFPNA
jgi:hypothetical protein